MIASFQAQGFSKMDPPSQELNSKGAFAGKLSTCETECFSEHGGESITVPKYRVQASPLSLAYTHVGRIVFNIVT